MRFVIIAIVFAELSVYGSVTGTVYAGHVPAAYEYPAMPIDPDDDEDDRVTTRERRSNADTTSDGAHA